LAIFDEITVHRINVVDTNGTLRLVISNKDRMHPGVIDGVTINRERPVAGLIFFNDQGDEMGGLVWSGDARNGRADGTLSFDQLRQDQVVQINHSEVNGQRSAGLRVWDQPETGLGELITKLNAANAIQDPTARQQAVRAARALAPVAPQRVFVGKNTDRAAAVTLADAKGRTRLALTVGADGEASIEFVDAQGRVTQRIPAR
jgi:hypothetical protein